MSRTESCVISVVIKHRSMCVYTHDVCALNGARKIVSGGRHIDKDFIHFCPSHQIVVKVKIL